MSFKFIKENHFSVYYLIHFFILLYFSQSVMRIYIIVIKVFDVILLIFYYWEIYLIALESKMFDK